MNTATIILFIGIGALEFLIGYCVGFQSCRDRALENLIDKLLEELEEEDH